MTREHPIERAASMLAFKVSCKLEETALVVIASTPGKAKNIALCSDQWEFAEFLDLTAKRYPPADHFAETYGVGIVPWNAKTVPWFREYGWHEYDRSGEVCERCGLYAFNDIPKSHLYTLNDGERVCVKCFGG